MKKQIKSVPLSWQAFTLQDSSIIMTNISCLMRQLVNWLKKLKFCQNFSKLVSIFCKLAHSVTVCIFIFSSAYYKSYFGVNFIQN
jgi:hypothetical protein